jgi:hypothetical protein
MAKALHHIVERAITEKGYKEVVSNFVDKYEEVLEDAWVKESDKAIEDAVKEIRKAKTDKTALAAMLVVLADKLKNITNAKDDKKLFALIDGLYKTGKIFESGKLKKKVGVTNLDKSVVKSLKRDGPYWIGNFYNSHLSDRIAEIGKKTIVDAGIGRVKAGKIMEGVLRKEFSLFGGKAPIESVIPAPFAGKVGDYTRIMTATVAQRDRVYSGISAISDAGFKTFEFIAVMDERTSEICQEMNGRTFTVESGISILENVAKAETPEDFKDVAPWPKNVEEIRKIAGKGSFESQNRNLEKSGIMLPPLHGL